MIAIAEAMLWPTIGFLCAVIYASFFEWILHRYVMHRPVGQFRYPFETHTLIHHRVFRADHTYHLINPSDAKTIPMAWWNGPAIIAVGLLPFVAAAAWLGHWGLLLGAAVACGAYYGVYEYMHWCMHLPKKRTVERAGVFFRLNGHHLLHHRYMGKNFNVVLPLADLLLGTLLLRSPIHFKQARGPSVPDVQPRVKLPKTAQVSSR
ncbi:MAG TPA: fatty acid hydroxylase [Verrucomicrobiae bacterium]